MSEKKKRGRRESEEERREERGEGERERERREKSEPYVSQEREERRMTSSMEEKGRISTENPISTFTHSITPKNTSAVSLSPSLSPALSLSIQDLLKAIPEERPLATSWMSKDVFVGSPETPFSLPPSLLLSLSIFI